MFRKKSKTAPAGKPAPTGEAAPKRSKAKLALLVAVPLLVLGGGGYGAWAMLMAKEEPVAEDGHGVDPQKVAALALESAAETSATYSFALSELLKGHCGEMDVPKLKAASDAEAEHNGRLVSLSWIAANRRVGSLTDKSCGRVQSEIYVAEREAGAGDKDQAKPGGHH